MPVCRGGEFLGESPLLAAIQARCREQLAALHAGVKRLQIPHSYPAGLAERKAGLIALLGFLENNKPRNSGYTVHS